VCFSVEIYIILQHCLRQNFSLKIVPINSLAGATVPYAAYIAF